MGGVGIVAATVLGVLVASRSNPDLLALALAALAMAAVGFVDDLRALSPQFKLLIQIILAATLLYFGLALHLTGFQLVDVSITLIWIVGITNAFNLLDNMDGLSATIAIVAAGFRLLFFAWDGQRGGVEASIVFIGALAGFLVRQVATLILDVVLLREDPGQGTRAGHRDLPSTGRSRPPSILPLRVGPGAIAPAKSSLDLSSGPADDERRCSLRRATSLETLGTS